MRPLLAAVGDTINLGNTVEGTPALEGLSGATFTVPNLLRVSIGLLVIAIAVASFLYLLVGAAQWVMAGGEKDGIEKARKKITGAIIGLVIAMSIFAILALINTIFNVDLGTNLVIPSIVP